MSAAWTAELELGYGVDGTRTVPILRRHLGPLRIQKGLLPEGPAVWHQIIVHPPGGIAGGDHLSVSLDLAAHAKVLITTPGASKWYRSTALPALQKTRLRVGAGASLEWLPMENIFFSGSQPRIEYDIELDAEARLISFDLHCLGRAAGNQTFEQGEVKLATSVTQADQLIFAERTRLPAGGVLQHSQTGLGGQPVFGTLLAYSPQMNDELLAQARQLVLPGEWAITRIKNLLIARWRGQHSDQGLFALRTLWAALRPAIIGRPVCYPRIWST
jgi:urease accessory protein